MSQDLSVTKKAYTFMEIFVAMLIFGIVSAGLALPFQQSMDLSSKNREITNANNLARMYLKETELLWQNQLNFDTNTKPNIDSKYTNNGEYTINLTTENLIQNSDGITVIKRVTISYLNKKQTELVNVFLDYNRP